MSLLERITELTEMSDSVLHDVYMLSVNNHLDQGLSYMEAQLLDYASSEDEKEQIQQVMDRVKELSMDLVLDLVGDDKEKKLLCVVNAEHVSPMGELGPKLEKLVEAVVEELGFA